MSQIKGMVNFIVHILKTFLSETTRIIQSKIVTNCRRVRRVLEIHNKVTRMGGGVGLANTSHFIICPLTISSFFWSRIPSSHFWCREITLFNRTIEQNSKVPPQQTNFTENNLSWKNYYKFVQMKNHAFVKMRYMY